MRLFSDWVPVEEDLLANAAEATALIASTTINDLNSIVGGLNTKHKYFTKQNIFQTERARTRDALDRIIRHALYRRQVFGFRSSVAWKCVAFENHAPIRFPTERYVPCSPVQSGFLTEPDWPQPLNDEVTKNHTQSSQLIVWTKNKTGFLHGDDELGAKETKSRYHSDWGLS